MTKRTSKCPPAPRHERVLNFIRHQAQMKTRTPHHDNLHGMAAAETAFHGCEATGALACVGKLGNRRSFCSRARGLHMYPTEMSTHAYDSSIAIAPYQKGPICLPLIEKDTVGYIHKGYINRLCSNGNTGTLSVWTNMGESPEQNSNKRNQTHSMLFRL